jgi:hypothetical protein
MDLHDLNSALEVLDGMAVTTSDGRYVRMEDVRRLMAQQEIEAMAEPEEPSFKTWEEARYAAKAYLREQNGPPPLQLGKAVPAFVSPSAVEGV